LIIFLEIYSIITKTHFEKGQYSFKSIGHRPNLRNYL
jgi:hypothetical protein